MVDIIRYIPPALHDVKEVQNICNSISKELLKLNDRMNTTYNNQFVDTMDSETCKRWEEIIGLSHDTTYTLQEQRHRIKTVIIEQLPYTKKTIENILKSICGEDGYSLSVDYKKFTIYIELALENKRAFDDVYNSLERILPANMVFNIIVMYNTNKVLSQFTHKQLEKYTYNQVRNEVLIF